MTQSVESCGFGHTYWRNLQLKFHFLGSVTSCAKRDRWLPITTWKVFKYSVFSGSYFLVFGVNTEIYSVNLCIQSEYEKIRTRKNSVFGHFLHSVCFLKFSIISSNGFRCSYYFMWSSWLLLSCHYWCYCQDGLLVFWFSFHIFIHYN